MSAQVKARKLRVEKWSRSEFTLTSGSVAYKGAKAALVLGTGKVVPATATASAGHVVIGTFAQDVDASAADKTVVVEFHEEKTIVRFFNSAGGAAVAATSIGNRVYVADDQTVSVTPGGAVVGRCWGVDTTKGVAVEIDEDMASHPIVGGTLAYVANDCVVTAAQAVDGAVYDVPTTGAASTITLPVTGVPDGTELTFVADGTKNGHTVTYRFGTTAISAAATASKIHLAKCVKLGSGWACNLTVSP